MNQTQKLTRKQAAKILELTFPDYQGRKISIEFTPRVTLYDLNWSGGTRNEYAAVRSDGKSGIFSAPAPWVNPYEGMSIEMKPEILLVEHSVFCGHDMGVRIYAHPTHLPKWLPGEVK